MIRRLVLLALAACLATAATAQPLPAQPLPARVDSLARAFVAQTGAPSLVVAVTRGGVRTVAGYGAVGGAVPDEQTRYEIGSVTKTFTGLALARAVLRGDVALDTPVQALLPDSVRVPVVGRPITLADLASHTSGLPRLPVPFAPAVFLDPYADFDDADLMRAVAAAQPDSAGVGVAYSNFGAGLLAWALAWSDGTVVGDVLLNDVTEPLGMADTYAGDDVATPRTTAGTDIAPWSWEDALVGAGGLRSHAADLLTLAEAVARPERAPALADAIRLATTPRVQASPRVRIGLGWHLLPGEGPVETVFHNGATFGSAAFVGVRPADDVGLVLLTNIGAPGPLDALAGQILQTLGAP